MSSIRKLMPADAPAFEAHLLRLDRESRHSRFNAYVSDAQVRRYCQSVHWSDGWTLGYFEDGVLRAVSQLVIVTFPWPREVELAVTVEPDWQNRGIGTELCRMAVLAAQNRGVRRIKTLCLMENRRMQRIAIKLDGQLLHLGGEVESALQVPPPNCLSFWQEVFGDGNALFDSLLDQWRPGPKRDDEERSASVTS